MIHTISGERDFLEFLRGKPAHFMLGMSTTRTCETEGITQAGIPGKIHLTPTLDAELLCSGEVRSLGSMAETPKGVPSPALITRAVHLCRPFEKLELLDLGCAEKPRLRYFPCHDFALAPSGSIQNGAQIDALAVFERGVAFGQEFVSDAEYVILAESVPAGTSTAAASAMALGYNAMEMFSSSFCAVPDSIRKETITKALLRAKRHEDIFAKLGECTDNMLLFYAGFILGSRKNGLKLLLAGGTQMAAVLLIVNSVVKTMGARFDASHVALCTTGWIYSDTNSDLKGLLSLLDFKINAYAADFDFRHSEHPALRLYDKGEAKEGVGAGAALAYAMLNGASPRELTQKIEELLR